MLTVRTVQSGVIALLVATAGLAPSATSAQSASETTTTSTNYRDVKEILDRRCVVCHSCYDAPCQLKLTSPDGILRGASKQVVYHTQRLEDAQPTRLGIDAQTTPEWRALGFYSVTQGAGTSDTAPSLLERYLELGRQNAMPANAPVPKEIGLETDRAMACPKPDEFESYAENNPMGGMPFAAAPLEDSEFETLVSWARNGARLSPAQFDLPDTIKAQIDTWEGFLNNQDLRSQLMSRYVYEHLFLARLHFEGDNSRRFFQLVRSTTPNGQEIDVIATRRPFDDPGTSPFFYRLELVEETIVHKEHLVYQLGPDRMARFEQLFLTPDWTLSSLPPYGDAEGGNPFSTFADIPVRSRYQFLLDDALFFVRSFIRGPVCHGETAVDVIEDRFWVSFLSPDADLSITDPSFLREGAPYLELPVSTVAEGTLGDLQGFSHENQVKYLEFRDARYRNSPAHDNGFGYDAIWDGDQSNPNALITVFRHFDNASAMTGFHGSIPETGWVIDYPILERIYYDLVAGYDVFGRVEHQLATRLYMDELRMESEDTFLWFMPKEARQKMHEGWYQGVLAEFHTYWHRRHVDNSFPTGIAFESTKPKEEFFSILLARGDGLWPISDPINRCSETECSPVDGSALRVLAEQPGEWVQYLPDLSVLLLEEDDGTTDLFTLVHDKAHKNVAFLFDEAARRMPTDDTLTILPGLIGSYPNLFFKIKNNQLPTFIEVIQSVRSQRDFMDVVASYGVRRTSPEFWMVSDQVYEIFLKNEPIQAGILDLNRYKDPKQSDKPN